MEAADIYREIGRTLHDLGADRAVLVKAKATPNASYEMNLEIAVDGSVNVEHAAKICMQKWRSIQVKFIDLDNDVNADLIQEIIEDGIII